VLLLSLSSIVPKVDARMTADPIKVLVFWGSWCANCPAMMAKMEKVRRHFAGRNVEFVAVSLEGEAQPQKYRAKGYGFKSRRDGDQLLARYQGVGVPWVVVTDAEGTPLAEPSRSGSLDSVAEAVRIELDLRT
jgi:thiol-disulfide isomerase/thioredoxin